MSDTRCHKCNEPIGPDGEWPISGGMGCLMCFEAEAGQMWWDAFTPSEPTKEETNG